MILEAFGKLSVAQALTTSVVSSNVIDIGALAKSGIALTNLWLDIETRVVAGGTFGSITFDVRLGANADLTSSSPCSIMQIVIAATSDKRVNVVGKKIYQATLPQHIAQLARDLGSTYKYLGIYHTVASSPTLTVNSAITPGRPPSDYYEQITDSNVGIPA
jgi:hypothetical protein